MQLTEPEERAARRETVLFIAVLTAGTVLAPAIPEGAVVLIGGMAVAWGLSGEPRRTFLRAQVARYHAPPLARASDCLVNVARHGAAFVRRPSTRPAVDLGLSAAFFVTIVAPIVLLELRKHSPSLEGAAVGLACGLVAWHVLLEVTHYARRRSEYRGDYRPGHLPVWPLLVLLLAELSAYLTVRLGGPISDDFVRGVLLGIAAMGVADAASLQSTLIAGVMGGRPLR